MAVNPLHRIDSPTDYRVLWTKLEHDLSEKQREYAELCAVENDPVRMRQHQGAYGAVAAVRETMKMLLASHRGAA